MVVGKPWGDQMGREEEEGRTFVASCSTSSVGSGQRNIMVREGVVSMEKIHCRQPQLSKLMLPSSSSNASTSEWSSPGMLLPWRLPHLS